MREKQNEERETRMAFRNTDQLKTRERDDRQSRKDKKMREEKRKGKSLMKVKTERERKKGERE